jgi:chromosomal replication initiator protein
VEHTTETTAEHLWESVAGRLRETLTETTYETWFGHASPVSLGDEKLVVEVPNDFTREWIEGHFLELIRAAVRDATGHQRRVQLTVTDTGATPDTQGPPVQRIAAETGLNTKYTFDLFVIGSSNRFAHAAALAVAEAPAQAYNPLFIYGGVGLGKTHLIHAVGNALLADRPDARILYLHAEQFITDVVKNYQRKTFDELKAKYHSLDLLLIEDAVYSFLCDAAPLTALALSLDSLRATSAKGAPPRISWREEWHRSLIASYWIFISAVCRGLNCIIG